MKTEPAVLHHGREVRGPWSQRGAAVCFNGGKLGGAFESSGQGWEGDACGPRSLCMTWASTNPRAG